MYYTGIHRYARQSHPISSMMPLRVCYQPSSTVFPSSQGAHAAESHTCAVFELHGTTGNCVAPININGRRRGFGIVLGMDSVSVWNRHSHHSQMNGYEVENQEHVSTC